MSDTARWVRWRVTTFVVYVLLRHAATFATVTLRRVSREARRRVRAGEYDLIVFNDHHFVPWVAHGRALGRSRSAHLHLDVHEYFVPTLPRTTLWLRATAGYYEWNRRLIGDPAFTTRSTVASGIADLYARELAIDPPVVIRNSPPFVDLRPSAVDPDRVRLIHHGTANWARGFRDLVEAMRLLDDRYTLTFMLAGDPAVIAELTALTEPLGDRVRVVPPVRMEELSEAVNAYDLEILFYRPATTNLEFALPNKLFEAIQGRLGLVVGRSPMMTEVVERYGNGIVVDGWTAADLARALGTVTTEQVGAWKAASDRAASELNAESEGRAFLALTTSAPTTTRRR
jgi:glycosyltransferase involved in cell wall biosynthesis